MCGILGGYFNKPISKDFFEKGKSILQHRGMDDFGFVENSEKISLNKISNQVKGFSTLHLLHAIVGHVTQPLISKNSILTMNGEVYNWKELSKKYNIKAENDAKVLHQLIDLKGLEIINECDGVFAIVFLNKQTNTIHLLRDRLGVKPMYYNEHNSNFLFSSEKIGQLNITKELSPLQHLTYDIKKKEITLKDISFEYPKEETKESKVEIEKKVYNLFSKAIDKRIDTNHNIGLLFSGGVDSTGIALYLKQKKIPFTCYTAKISAGNLHEAQDYIYAKKIAKIHKLDLKVATIDLEELEEMIIETMKVIQDCEYIKTSVALPFFASCRQAQKDNIKIMFSGLGSEELFAGYRRHRNSEKPNLECFEGLKILHKRDLYRDDVISMNFNQEMRLPFLDKDLVDYSLLIPENLKIEKDKSESKIIFRDVTKKFLKLEHEFAYRKKQAAQYGSKFDKGILLLCKKNKLQKQEYLDALWKKHISKEIPERKDICQGKVKEIK